MHPCKALLKVRGDVQGARSSQSGLDSLLVTKSTHDGLESGEAGKLFPQLLIYGVIQAASRPRPPSCIGVVGVSGFEGAAEHNE